VEERLAELQHGRLGRQIPPVGGEVERLRRWIVQEIVDRLVEHDAARLAGWVRHGIAGSTVSGRPVLPEVVSAQLFEVVTKGVIVPDGEARSYYERNLDLYEHPEERHVRYAIASSGREAWRALLAWAHRSQRPGGSDVRYGELTRLVRGELSGPVEDAVFEAAAGDLVGPLPFGSGAIAARVEAVRAAAVASFDEVRPTIEAELLAVARARAYDDWLATRRAAVARIEPEFEHPGHPLHGLPSHRH
jgi:[acyl-carrier-protein] S-malonyltransferase